MTGREYVECHCPGWRRSARQERDARVHYQKCTGVEYTGDMIRFCPWCGVSLEKKESESKVNA